MKRIFTSILIALSAILATEAARYNIRAGAFSEINVVDALAVDVIFDSDSAGYVTFDCPPEIAPMIIVANDKNALKLQVQNDGTTTANLPRITVHAAMLSKISNSGDSTVTVTAPPSSAQLSFRVIGNGAIVARELHATVVEGKIDTGHGSLVLAGVTNWLKLRTVGTGSIEAGGLKAERASIFMSGTGNVDCCVAGELTVTGLSSGKIYCKGKPKIKNRTLGSVKVIEVD